MPLKLSDKQSVLEIYNVSERLEFLMAIMETEIDLLKVEKELEIVLKNKWKKSKRILLK